MRCAKAVDFPSVRRGSMEVYERPKLGLAGNRKAARFRPIANVEAQCLSLKAAILSRMSGCPPAEPVENAGYEKHRRNEPEQDREDPRGYTADRAVV